MPELVLALNLAAIVNGAILAAMLLFARRPGDSPIGLHLAGFLALTASSLAAFVLLDSGRLVWRPEIGVALDLVALLASGLFANWVIGRLGRRLSPWAYLPAAIYAGACVVAGGRPFAPTDIGVIVIGQVLLVSVAVAAWLLEGRRGLAGDALAEWRRLAVVLGAVVLFHALQVARLLLPANPALFEAVPLMGAAGLLAFSIYALAGSRALGSLIRRRRAPPVDLSADDILKVLEESGLYLDPDASLAKAAELLGVKPYVVSRALNAAGGVSFPQAINRIRIDKAKRMLRAPEEARTSIDAISGLCGFRSRSAFYVAFQEVEGVSPAAWRKG